MRRQAGARQRPARRESSGLTQGLQGLTFPPARMGKRWNTLGDGVEDYESSVAQSHAKTTGCSSLAKQTGKTLKANVK